MSGPEYKVIRVIMAGDGAVGKTTLVKRMLKKNISDISLTVGVEFETFSLNHNYDGKTVVLIYDVGGQKQFRNIISSFLPKCDILVLMFDLTRYSTFKNLKSWLDIVQTFDKKYTIVVGNKLDLREKRSVKREDIDSFLKEMNFSNYIELSAKTGENLDEFVKMLENIIKKRDELSYE